MTITATGRPAALTVGSERAPAYDLDAEKVILGILMISPGAHVTAAGVINPDDFYSPKHGELFKAICDIADGAKPVDRVALAGMLADRGDLNRLGGGNFLLECCEMVPVAAQLKHYADRVVSLAEKRRYEADALRIVHAATAPGVDVEDIADMASNLLVKSRPRRAELDLTSLGSLINPCLDDIENRRDEKVGITTGFIDLDRMLGGLRRKQLVTIAGATGMGKSIMLVDLARHIAIKLGMTVALFSLEMSKEEIFDRILAAEAGVPHHCIRDGNLHDGDWQRISAKLGPMSNAPLFLCDKAPMTVADMLRQSRKLKEQHGQLDVVMVDHMHLVSPSDRCLDERARLENVSRGLKLNLAMDLDLTVVAAAQLNRNHAARSSKRPELTDLKNSSSIEQDSNVVVLIHRDDHYDPESPRAGEADFLVEKNRNGSKGVVTVAAQLHLSRFKDMAIAA